jgi:trk system potassium uptake protein TrkA
MRVVIVGAGHDGAYLAERLVAEGQDVVVIEIDEAKAAAIQDRLDVLVIPGNGASPSVLKEAGVPHAGLFLAVSDRDGANVMACHSAKNLGARRTVARVEHPDLREISPGLGVDVIIDARQSVAREAAELVRYMGVSEIEPLALSRLMLVGGRVRPDAPAIGKSVADLRAQADVGWALAALVKNGKTVVGRGSVVFDEGDHAVLVVHPEHVRNAMNLIGIPRARPRRSVVLGGTSIAALTADRILDQGHDVLIVEREADRCASLAKESRALVLQGDPADSDVLERLDLGPSDVVLGMSGFDQLNLMGCMLAKAMGAGATIARFGKARLARLLKDVGVDAIVSSRVAVADAILRFVRRDQILSVSTFMDTDAELIEIEVQEGTPAAGATVEGLHMPPGTVMAGVVRGGTAMIPTGATRIEVGDRVVVFAERHAIDRAEELFLK